MRIDSYQRLAQLDTARETRKSTASEVADAASGGDTRHGEATGTLGFADTFERASGASGLFGGADPRAALHGPSLERETAFDRGQGVPPGMSLEQGLPAGLDGRPLAGGPNHHGVGNDPLLVGRDGGDLAATVGREVGIGLGPAGAGNHGAGGSSQGSGIGKRGDLPPGAAPVTSNPGQNLGLVG